MNFHFGDTYSDSSKSNLLWELFKVIVPVAIAVFGILFQKYLERKREEKKQKLQLFNFNEHLKTIMEGSKPIAPVFKAFSDNIFKDPFGEHLIETRFIIPDINRILEINKESVFSAFIITFDDKVTAANTYRKAYNSVEYFKQLFDLLNNRYDTIMQEIYEQKLRFKDGIAEIRQALSNMLVDIKRDNSNYLSLPEYNDLNNPFFEYLFAINDDIGNPLQFHADSLLIPMRDALLKYQTKQSAQNILSLIKVQLNLRNDIIFTSSQLGTLIGVNSDNLLTCLGDFKTISSTLDSKLIEFTQVKKGVKHWLSKKVGI